MRKKGTLTAVMKQMKESLDSDRNKSGTNTGASKHGVEGIYTCRKLSLVQTMVCVWTKIPNTSH